MLHKKQIEEAQKVYTNTSYTYSRFGGTYLKRARKKAKAAKMRKTPDDIVIRMIDKPSGLFKTPEAISAPANPTKKMPTISKFLRERLSFIASFLSFCCT